MAIKRNCGGCKAYTASHKCELGHKTKPLYFDRTIQIDAAPLEECPKPLTNSNYIGLLISKMNEQRLPKEQ